MNEQARLNIPELTVSELSAALKKTVEDAYGYVRVRGEISGYRGPHSSGHCYFALKDEGAKIEAVIWRREFARLRIKPEEGLEVIVTGRLTTYPGQSKYQIVVETLEPAGRRRADGAGRGAQEEARRRRAVRPGAQAAAAVPARGDRRRHLADRRRHPRHFASARRPLSAPRGGVAGAGAGRRLGRGGRRRHPRLQCAAGAGAVQARPDHRRARRRLARGSVVVQRGDRGAGGGREPDPADLGGRPRDRRDADRFRRRRARADADRGRRDGGAGAQRADDADRQPGAPLARLLAALPGGAARGAALGAAGAAEHRRDCWPRRASGSTRPARGFRAR